MFLPPAASMLNSYQLYTADIAKVITSAPLKSCELDPIPTDILKQFLPQLLPFITRMCNASLRAGILPTSQRSANITPRLKKTGSDQADVQNYIHYRPISNLMFMSKVIKCLQQVIGSTSCFILEQGFQGCRMTLIKQRYLRCGQIQDSGQPPS